MNDAMLTMVLDLDVERHRREIADAFAAARARLIPAMAEAPPDPQAQWNLMPQARGGQSVQLRRLAHHRLLQPWDELD